MNIDTLNGTVLHVDVVARPIIKGVDIDVIAINGQRRQILLSERAGIPQRFKRRRRNGLQVTAGKRNQNNALRNNGTARAVHGRTKLQGSHDGTHLGVDLVEDGIPRLSTPHRSARDKVHLSVRHNGVRCRDARTRLLLFIGQKIERPRRRISLRCGRKGIRCRSRTAVCKTVPRCVDIGVSGSRIGFWLSAWNKRARSIHVSKLNGIALNRQIPRCHNGGIRAINDERPIAPWRFARHS